MKAMVLGATGFIGSHIARALLNEGWDVRILKRSIGPSKALGGLPLEEKIGNLNDLASLRRAFRGCEVLFHSAGYYPLYSFGREKQKELALSQMENVLRAAAETPSLKKIVYTSSMSTVGKSHRGLANEDTPYDVDRFKGLYYEVKYEMETRALEGAAEGLPIVVLNPTAVFGDYDVKPTSGSLLIALAKGRLPVVFDAKMNVVDVRDVARAQIAAMKKGVVGERYVVGGHNTTVWAFTHLVAQLAHVRPPILRLPLVLGRWAAYASEYLGRYLLHQNRPMIPHVGIDFLEHGMHYDTRKAQKKFALNPTLLEETLERALTWFKRNGYV
jgi:dihydroflavonol-4-reductase